MRRFSVVAVVLTSALVLTACDGGTAGHVARHGSGTVAATTETSTTSISPSTTLPVRPTRLTLVGLPRGDRPIKALRSAALISGSKNYEFWYGASLPAGPDFTSGVTTGPDAKFFWSNVLQHAAGVGVNSGAANAGSIPAPIQVTVNGAPGIVFQDSLGWTQIEWYPRTDLLLGAVGYRVSYVQMEALAAKSVLT